MDKKNIIIGLDGATWEIIDYFIDENIMPNLRNLKDKGSYGKLKSTVLPVTPAAWASMITGCNPSKTGVFHFLKSSGKENTYLKVLVNGDDIRTPTMWDILSSYGRDVISINVPMTFPPKPVNGIMISGMMTPRGESNFTYPGDLKNELAWEGIDYRIDTYSHRTLSNLQDDDFVKQLFSNGAENFFNDLNELLDIRKRTVTYLMENRKWQYFMLVIIGIDRIQHHFWDYIKNPELDFKISENIRKYYKKVDEFVGELCSEFRNTGNVFIVSDHGFAKLHGDFIIDGWLLQKGYLRIKGHKIENWRTVLKRSLKKCGINVAKISEFFLKEEKIHKLRLSASNIDWLHTFAYGVSINGINVNLKGRETLGCVEESKYDEIRGKIINDLMSITNSQGIKIVKNVLKKESVYSEGPLNHIPDLILEFDESILYRAIPTEHVSKNMDIFKTYKWLTGNHIRDGVFLALGKDIKEGILVEKINIEDILPTVLALNDEKIPKHLDGGVIKDIMNRELKENYINYEYAARDEKYKYSKNGEQDLKEKLKSLGYM